MAMQKAGGGTPPTTRHADASAAGGTDRSGFDETGTRNQNRNQPRTEGHRTISQFFRDLVHRSSRATGTEQTPQFSTGPSRRQIPAAASQSSTVQLARRVRHGGEDAIGSVLTAPTRALNKLDKIKTELKSGTQAKADAQPQPHSELPDTPATTALKTALNTAKDVTRQAYAAADFILSGAARELDSVVTLKELACFEQKFNQNVSILRDTDRTLEGVQASVSPGVAPDAMDKVGQAFAETSSRVARYIRRTSPQIAEIEKKLASVRYNLNTPLHTVQDDHPLLFASSNPTAADRQQAFDLLLARLAMCSARALECAETIAQASRPEDAANRVAEYKAFDAAAQRVRSDLAALIRASVNPKMRVDLALAEQTNKGSLTAAERQARPYLGLARP